MNKNRYKFDDDNVTITPVETVMENAFGGSFHELHDYLTHPERASQKPPTAEKSTNAYVLVYIRKSMGTFFDLNWICLNLN